LSQKEIARQLGISPHTVKNLLAGALEDVRNFLTDHGYPILAVLFIINDR
jgi:DNA-directed RNA polymerase specialized sigma24 family protein